LVDCVSDALQVGLESPEPAARAAACGRAARHENAVLFVDRLDVLLGDPDARVATAAADALATIGAHDPGVAGRLRAALRGNRPNARWAAAFATARSAPADAALLPALIEALDQPGGDVRWRALRELVRAAHSLPEIRPLLTGLAELDSRPRVREMAVHGLRHFADGDPAVERALAAAARNPEARVRRAAVVTRSAIAAPHGSSELP
jgi:HEAT repeat protein